MFIEIIALYAPYKRLGPLLVVLQNLTRDVLAFFALFLVILLSYGAVLYATLYPMDELNGSSIVRK